MGLFRKRKINYEKEEEKRAEEEIVADRLLRALIGQQEITKEQAMAIPSVKSCIEIISNTIAMIPIKLFTEKNGEVEELKKDKRIALLNDDTGDTLNAFHFRKAMMYDYFLEKGAFAYIEKNGNEIVSIRYVKSSDVSTIKNVEPIFKDYDIYVRGKRYLPYEFIKILRQTEDGCTNKSILEESSLIQEVIHSAMTFERTLVKKGGNKKGFLTSENTLTKDAVETIRTSYKEMYSNNTENIVVLNKGMDFKEASNTAVEMQLNENKKANSAEIYKIFNMPKGMIEGGSTEEENKNFIRYCIMPILHIWESELNRLLLLEKEKESHYFSFDTKELLKGNIKERYEAYGIGIEKNFLQVDDVRYMEDLKPIGFNFVKLGLDSVLYNPVTQEIYTPNTNKTQKMNEKSLEGSCSQNTEEKLEGGEENENRD